MCKHLVVTPAASPHAALHAAALSGHVSTAQLLLQRGAMVDALDVMKHTPLFRACEMGQRDVILTLIKGITGETLKSQAWSEPSGPQKR